MLKYSHNAVSRDSPENFQINHGVVIKEKLMISRKKQIKEKRIEEITPRNLCHSLPPMTNDQDLDSIRFSDREAVNLGFKNSVRYKSNFFKLFYENPEKLFSKPQKEITYLQPVQKITRVDISPFRNLKVQNSIKKLFESSKEQFISNKKDINLKNKLKYKEFMDTSPSASIKLLKGSLPSLKKVKQKIHREEIAEEINDFEKKMPKPEDKKGNQWYIQTILTDRNTMKAI